MSSVAQTENDNGNLLTQSYNEQLVVVVVVFYCPYAQSINCGEDISVETDECRHISVINIDVKTQ